MFRKNQNLSGKSVVIIEDIVDTGNTLVALKELFKSQNVKLIILQNKLL